MRHYLFTIISSLILSLLSCSCSGNGRDEKASEMGRKDAEELISLFNAKKRNELKIQDFLLEVKEKERQLNAVGMGKGAAKYIETFKRTIYENDSALYKSVFELEK